MYFSLMGETAPPSPFLTLKRDKITTVKDWPCLGLKKHYQSQLRIEYGGNVSTLCLYLGLLKKRS